MSTFHNFNSCIYSAQGKIVCQNDKKDKSFPLVLEGFINTTPNQKDPDCSVLSTKFGSVLNSYNCDTDTNNTANSCSFNYKCNQDANKCNLISKNLTTIVSKYNCTSKTTNSENQCTFNYNCSQKTE